MPDGRTLICSYRYVSIMFVFKLAWGRRWHLIGRDRAMDVETNRAELERLYGGGQVPDIGLFERFGLLLTGAVIIGAVAVSAAVQAVLGLGSDTVATAASGSDEPVAVVVSGDDADEDGSEADGEANSQSDPDDPDDEDDLDDPADGADADNGADEDGADGSTSTIAAEPSSSPSDGGLYEVAEIPEPVDDQPLVSTNLTGLQQGWSELVVDKVYATSVFSETEAASEEKFVIVEYQLVGVEGNANVFDTTFRLEADDGMVYSPTLVSINDVIQAGQAINTFTVFTVPRDQTWFRFEAGVLEAAGDGYQSAYDLELMPAEPEPAPERWDGPWETVSGEQTSPLTTFTGSTLNPQQPALALEFRGGKTTAKLGPDAAAPGFKFLEVEVKVIGSGGISNLTEPAFRVRVDGELYSPKNSVNEVIRAGEAWSGSMIFQIPASATAAEFEAGVPEDWDKGSHLSFALTFADGPGS